MSFEPNSLPTLIGSLPLKEHTEATRMVLEYMPEIPLWVQLPCYPEERLLSQFAENLPGIRGEGDSLYFDSQDPSFESELLSFFEQFISVTEEGSGLSDSIFAFSERTGRGFNTFLSEVSKMDKKPVGLKGQITGPFTMLTGLKDKAGRAAYFDSQLREAVVKAVGLKARFQVEAMKKLNENVLLFFDEPALSGFGSSAMVGITKEEVIADLTDVIETIHEAGALAGIHVCANTDWSLIFATPVDIISFDAYGYFDRMELFKTQLIEFMEKGKIVAWGLVPTLNSEDLEREDVSSLKARWDSHVKSLGGNPELIKKQALITPSCGTGLLSVELTQKALGLTRDLSRIIRNQA